SLSRSVSADSRDRVADSLGTPHLPVFRAIGERHRACSSGRHESSSRTLPVSHARLPGRSTSPRVLATLQRMAQLRLPPTTRPIVTPPRPPRPIDFPEAAVMPEGKTHLVLRTFLFRLLRFALGPGHSLGSDQFVYWIASDPHRFLAPDVFVRLGVPDT